MSHPVSNPVDDAMVTAEYPVIGMSCGHCVQAVTVEVSAIPGVEDVRVDLPTGLVTVVSTTPIDRAELAAAVDEAGYALA